MKRLANIDIKYIKGVGEARAKILVSEFNIRTVCDFAIATLLLKK
jgi:hypothetical protein